MIVVSGGVDLVRAKTNASAGSLADVLNWEVGREDGVTQIDGFDKHHGSPANSLTRTFVLYWENASALDPLTLPSVGNQLRFKTDAAFSSVTGYVVYAATVNVTLGLTQSHYIFVVFSSSFSFDETSAQVYNATTAAYVGSLDVPEHTWNILPTRNLRGTVANYATYTNTLAAASRADVIPVPGRYGSSVIGLHSFNDRLYAVKDYTAITVRDTYVSDPALVPVDGDVLFDQYGIKRAEVVKVYDDFGPWNTSGRFDYRNHRIIVRDEYPIANPYTGPAFTDAETLYNGTKLGSFFDAPIAVPLGSFGLGHALTEVGTYLSDLTEDTTEAALWSDIATGGWKEIDLLREVRFRNGTETLRDLPAYQRNAFSSTTDGTEDGTAVAYTSTDWLVPGGAVASSEGATFNNVVNILAEDGTTSSTGTGLTALYDGASLWASTFDLDLIPDTATITGVEVQVKRKTGNVTVGESVTDAIIALAGIGPLTVGGFGASLARTLSKDDPTTLWPSALTSRTYGGQNDLWGMTEIPVSAVKATNFGVIVTAKLYSGGDGTITNTAEIDSIKIRVHYINATSKIYLRNSTSSSPTDVQATLVAIQKTAGDWTNNTAEGVLTIRADKDAFKTRLVSDGDEIRTLAGGSGTLVGTAAGKDYAVTLPSQAEMGAEESRYVCINENFYADPQFRGMYCANGAGPAFVYDGTATIRIHTELRPALNKPRHIAKHGRRLMLLHKSGILLASSITDTGPNPINFVSEDGATAREYGSRCAGLLPLNSDALGIFLDSRIYALRGQTNQSYQDQVLAANSGAIEYTAVDMGENFAMYTNNFGVGYITPTDVFGDYTPGKMSWKVWPWLKTRVQVDARFTDRQPVLALPFRNKNQYRVYFADGYILTMTLKPDRTAEGTFQRYGSAFLPSNGAPVIPAAAYPVLAATSGVYSDGRERAFFSKDSSDSYVYEIDSGVTFAGEEIEGYVVFNWANAGDSKALKKFDRVFFYGLGYGYATASLSRVANFNLAGPPITTETLTFGATTSTATADAVPLKSKGELALEGYETQMRIDTTNGTYGPLSIQSFDLVGSSKGNSRGHVG